DVFALLRHPAPPTHDHRGDSAPPRGGARPRCLHRRAVRVSARPCNRCHPASARPRPPRARSASVHREQVRQRSVSALVVPCAIVAAFVLAVAFVDAAVAAALIAGLVFTRLPAVLLHSDSIAPMVLAGVLGAVASARWRRDGGGRNRRALGFGLAGASYLSVLALSYLWASDLHATARAVQELV